MAEYPKIAQVLFDEAHSEAWSIDPSKAAQMQPSHPEDSSLAFAAKALATRDFTVSSNGDRTLDAAQLDDVAVLILAHPSDPKWEATSPGSPLGPRLSEGEIDAIERFVADGGGLVVLGETEQDKYGNNLNDLIGRFGIEIANATVQDYENHREAPSWVLADLVAANGSGPAGADPLARVTEACFYRAGYLEVGDGVHVIAQTSAAATPPNVPLAALTEHGAGRVAVLADSDLFGDDCIGEPDHLALWLNLIYWVSAKAFAVDTATVPSPALADPEWVRLRNAVTELRDHQAPDGSVEDVGNNTARLGELVETIADSAAALEPHFPHQSAYITALGSDLRRWAAEGYGAPDFAASIDLFRPEQVRQDGIEHLVVFPMYKQNASRDICFEALIVRVPWPEWTAELEARFTNAKFVPVNFVDFTAGYDSECAVLFPETFAAAERPPAHFGGIFCDREAERFRRVCGAAAEILRLNLPPDAAALLASPELSRDAYIAWDLIHDRTHMRGDLPFDPFMIRQRSPYWMYSLEELRCDLTTFGEAVTLEAEGHPLGRYVQYAIVFDRLFRFPLTGDRVRNYDGLGGQLLFAFLHSGGYLHWTDLRLTVDWNRLADGVGGLHQRVSDLYRSGIDRSKLGQWIAAHDLVSEFVAPAPSSVWARESRNLPEVEEPKELVDLVRDDEFPLSLFYTQLQPKLEPSLARPGMVTA